MKSFFRFFFTVCFTSCFSWANHPDPFEHTLKKFQEFPECRSWISMASEKARGQQMDEGALSFLIAVGYEINGANKEACVHYERALKIFQNRPELSRFAFLSKIRPHLLQLREEGIVLPPQAANRLLFGTTNEVTDDDVYKCFFDRTRFTRNRNTEIDFSRSDLGFHLTGRFPWLPYESILPDSKSGKQPISERNTLSEYPSFFFMRYSIEIPNSGDAIPSAAASLPAISYRFSGAPIDIGSFQSTFLPSCELETLALSYRYLYVSLEDKHYFEIVFSADLIRFCQVFMLFPEEAALLKNSIVGTQTRFDYAKLIVSIPKNTFSFTSPQKPVTYLHFDCAPDHFKAWDMKGKNQ